MPSTVLIADDCRSLTARFVRRVIPECQNTACAECKKLLLLTPSSLVLVQQQPDVIVLCMSCGPKRMADKPLILLHKVPGADLEIQKVRETASRN